MSAIIAAKGAIASGVKIPVGHLWLTGELIVPAGASAVLSFLHMEVEAVATVHEISLLQACFVKQESALFFLIC